jgi:hypothetical protein
MLEAQVAEKPAKHMHCRLSRRCIVATAVTGLPQPLLLGSHLPRLLGFSIDVVGPYLPHFVVAANVLAEQEIHIV